MTEKIVDINREDISSMTMFHFNHSLRPFILISAPNGGLWFVDLTQGECYPWENELLKQYSLYFYTDEKDEDFCGVAIIGEINY